jgi:uncharacterized protein (TIGR02246 family)
MLPGLHKKLEKQMKILQAIILAVVLVCQSLQGQSRLKLSELEREQIEADVLKVIDFVIDAARIADVEAMFSVIAEDATLIRNGSLSLSKSEAFAFYQQAYLGVQKVEYRFSHQKVIVLSMETVLVIADGESILTTTDNRIFNTSFAQTTVYRRTDNDWRVLHTHVSVPKG